jgi:hypothetical protein
MKKVFLIGFVIVLLFLAAIPVMAAGPHNGRGNGNKSGQGNNAVDQSQDTAQVRGNSQNKGNRFNGRNNTQTGNRQKTPFYLQGTITAINPTAKTLTVSVFHGNARVKLYIGTDLPLSATATTRIFKITQTDEDTGAPYPAPSTGVAPPTGITPSTNSNDEETPGERVAITFEQLAVGDTVAIHGIVVGSVYTATLITVYVKTPTQPPASPVAPVGSSDSEP